MSNREIVLNILKNEIFYPDVASVIISFLDVECRSCHNKMLHGEGYKTIWDYKICYSCVIKKQFEKCKICKKYSPVILTNSCICIFLCRDCKEYDFLF